jgi:hypothetical protein
LEPPTNFRHQQGDMKRNRSEITVNDRAMESSKQAQRAVIQFLSTGVSGNDIYSRMQNVYGTECIHSVPYTFFSQLWMLVPLTPVDKNWITARWACLEESMARSLTVSVNNTLSLSGVYQISPDVHCHLPENSQSSTAGNYGAPTSVPLSLGQVLYKVLSYSTC